MTDTPLPFDEKVEVILRHDYSVEALGKIRPDVREFVDGSSWAAEVHKDAMLKLQKAAIIKAHKSEMRRVIGEDEGHNDLNEGEVLDDIVNIFRIKRNILRAEQRKRAGLTDQTSPGVPASDTQ